VKQPPRRPSPPRRPIVDDDDDDEPTQIFDRNAHLKAAPPAGEALFPLEEIEAWEHTMMMDNAPVRPPQQLGVPRPPKDPKGSFPAPPVSVRTQNRQAFDAIAQHIAGPTPPPPGSASEPRNRRRSERPPAHPAHVQTRSAFPPPPHASGYSSSHVPHSHSPQPPHVVPQTHPLAPPMMSPMPPPVVSMTPPPHAVSAPPPVATSSPFARSQGAMGARPASLAPPGSRVITTSRTRPPPVAGLILFAAPMALAMLLILALAFS
jgi:hypothetical protein